MEDPAPDAPAILGALAQHGVEFLLVGGFAVNFHGYPRFTADIDILVRPDERNYARLSRAIAKLDPDWRLPGGRDPAPVEELAWGFGEVARFLTPHGVLDAHREIEGIRADYEELERRSITVEVDELRVRVVGYDDLIAMKRAAGRPEDLADISALEDARRAR